MTQQTLFQTGGAVLSDDGRYRYLLWRDWGPGQTSMLWAMLNASKADASIDDPTIKVCMGIARREGCDRMVVVNLYGYRATDPKDMRRAEAQGVDIIGPENDGHIRWEAGRADYTVAAWGANADPERAREVLGWLRHPLHLGLTKSGQPRHPLYVKRDTPLVLL